jgi:acyl-CoA synthetase (NDP forming)/GNAT superfamily N-acetyltransferase
VQDDGVADLLPRDWSAPPADVLLTDGSIAVVRSLEATDRDAVLALHENVSDDTLRLRFFTTSREAGRRYVDHLFDEANEQSAALVAVVRGRVAGLATAEVLGPDRAEVAFLVSDDESGRGLGSLLLEHLAALGRAHGVNRFDADVLGENHGMLRVFRGAGFAISRRTEAGEVTVELRTDVSAAALDAADRREWRAEARSLRPLLAPEGVAVVGVRRTESGVGRAVLDAIRSGGYAGRLSVVHPSASSVAGVPAYSSLASVPGPVDLVVVVVPADQVSSVMTDVCAVGAGAAIIVSAGFAGAGEPVGRGLLELARAHSVRVVGPDSQGVLSRHAAFNASFARELPPVGGLAVAAQSGGVGFTVLDLARAQGVGVHSFVSLGAKLDVSSNDLLAAWGDDERVTVAALYLESFGNALKFARTARRFASRKPLLAVAGGSAATEGVTALFAQAGVIPCRGAADIAEAAAVLTQQPLPSGFRVGVVTNAGGMGLLTAGMASGEGLSVPALSPSLVSALSSAVPVVSAANPVDLGADVSPASLSSALGLLLASSEVDAAVVTLVPTVLADPVELRAAVASAALEAGKPVVVVASDVRPDESLPGLTAYRTPLVAVVALARAMRYAAWRRVSADEAPPVDAARAAAARSFASQRLANRGGVPEWLPDSAAASLLAGYGVQPVGSSAVGPMSAASAATSLGWPVVVKVADPAVRHRTDRGLVRVGLTTPDAVADAVTAFAAELGVPAASLEVRVQPVVAGVELAVGMVRDETYGPLVRVAAGGVATDLLHDEVHLLAPVSPADAGRALRGLRTWPLLDGVRGLARVDVDALEALVVSVGQLAVDVPEVAVVDLNPVLASPDGVHCVDVKVRLEPAGYVDVGFPRRLRPSAG